MLTQFLNSSKKYYLAIILTGIIAGISSAFFLQVLSIVTHYRIEHDYLIYTLPIIGFISSWFYLNLGEKANAGNHLIIDEIHENKNRIPLRMYPLALLSTLLSHLGGASVGREGTAIQLSGSIAEKIGTLLKVNPNERRRILIIGLSAGFGSALGAPLAGMFFGSEVIHGGKIEKETLIESGIASYLAFYMTELLKTQHTHYPHFDSNGLKLIEILFLTIFSSILFGIGAQFFSKTIHLFEDLFHKIKIYSPIKTFFSGIIIVLAYKLIGNLNYAGLGLESIQQSFHIPAHFFDAPLKILLTALSIGGGFKGGDFVPAVFVGSHLGSFFSIIDPKSILLLSALGFCSVFAGAANAPLTSAIMAVEFFGIQILPFAIISCYISYFFSGYHGVYKTQKLDFKMNLKRSIYEINKRKP